MQKSANNINYCYSELAVIALNPILSMFCGTMLFSFFLVAYDVIVVSVTS